MALEGKRLDSITEQTLVDLIADQSGEGLTIDYKQGLPSNRDSDKKEFLADLTSFANSAGGHLVYGMDEQGGLPIRLTGLPGIDAEAAILRLESIAASGIEPRIPGLAMRAVPLQAGAPAVIVAIPRSWSRPHQVSFQDWDRFYARNSSGKYLLDIPELRALFGLADRTGERIARFRAERLAQIEASEAPAALAPGGRVVLHVVPFGAFDPASRIDVASVMSRPECGVWPIGVNGINWRYNFDGVLTFPETLHAPVVSSYLQLFRNGAMEAVSTALLDQGNIPSTALERALIERLADYLALQQRLGLAPPVAVLLSLLGVRGYPLLVDRSRPSFTLSEGPIDRDALLFPEVLVEELTADPSTILQPVFDALWNAAGWPRAMSYDAGSGAWLGGRN